MKTMIRTIAIITTAVAFAGIVQAAPPGKGPVRSAKSGKKVTTQKQSDDTCGAALKRIGPPGKGLRRHRRH
jgi:hypothetical protein